MTLENDNFLAIFYELKLKEPYTKLRKLGVKHLKTVIELNLNKAQTSIEMFSECNKKRKHMDMRKKTSQHVA